MAYTKNLGRVKGKKGNYFVPSVSFEQGQLKFTWTETEVADEESSSNSEIPPSFINTPIFYPNYDPDTGELSFTPTVPFIKDGLVINAGDDTQFKWNIRGPRGYPGETKLNVEFITDKTFEQAQSEIEQIWETIDSKLAEKDNPTRNDAQLLISQYLGYKTDTLYVFTLGQNQNEIHPIYIYYESDLVGDEITPRTHELRKLQDVSLDLENYYTKAQTYSQTEIDDLTDIQNTYLEKIYELLDVPSDTYTIAGQEMTNEALDAYFDSKLEGYVKLENVQYVDIEGTLYFVSYDPNTSESNNGE